MPTSTTRLRQDLEARRARIGLTKVELARRAGMDLRHLRRVLHGYINATAATLDRIEAALDGPRHQKPYDDR